MSFESPTALRAEVEFWIAVGEELVSVPCSLNFQPEQPFEFTATFHAGDSDVSWYLSRELVAAGMIQPAGQGDVRVLPRQVGAEAPSLIFELRSEQGCATLHTDLAGISAFLDQTFQVVAVDADYPWPAVEDLVSLADPRQLQTTAEGAPQGRCASRRATGRIGTRGCAGASPRSAARRGQRHGRVRPAR